MKEQLDWPEWADEVAVDPDGVVWAFEGGCHWNEEMGEWLANSDGDDELDVVVHLERKIRPELARTLRFRRVPSEEGA